MAVILWWGTADGTPPKVLMTLLAIAPLLLPLPGLWRGSRYTAAWASLLVVPYMLLGVVESIANPAARLAAGIELGLSFALFAGLLVFARTAGTRH